MKDPRDFLSDVQGPEGRRSDLTGLGNLIKAVEADLIPRLVATRVVMRAEAPKPDSAEVHRLVLCMIGDDDARAEQLVEQVAGRGVSQSDVCLELLAPAARRMGDLWTEDRISFTDVTLGLAMLHRILFRMENGVRRQEGDGARCGRVLIAPCPGEQHYFGALMAARFFALDGWQVWTELRLQPRDLGELTAQERFDVVGLSISGEALVPQLKETVAAIRGAIDPAPAIVLGGDLAANRDGLADEVDADTQVADAPSAIGIVRKLADLRMSGPSASRSLAGSG